MYRIKGTDGKEYGPVTADVLRQWIAEGRANAQSTILAEGATEWKPLSAFPEFATSLAPAPIAALPSIYPQQPKTNSLAVTGLVLGIFSVTFGLCCCYGLPFNLVGLICSSIALAQISKEPRQQGKGMAVAGLVLCALSLVLTLVLISVWGFLVTNPELMRRIQRL